MKNYVCKACGSENIVKEVQAQWNKARQKWEVSDPDVNLDAICRDCEANPERCEFPNHEWNREYRVIKETEA
jgi:hypothetical protein